MAIVVADDPFYAPGTSPGQRRFSSAALLAGPLALLAAQLLDPTPAEADAADLLATAAAEPARWVATNLLFVLGAILLVFGSFGVASLLRGRGSRLGQLGLALLVAGVVALAGWAISNLALEAVAAADGGEAVAAAISDSPANTAVEIVWIVGLMLGLVLVAVALLRAGSVPRWAPASILVFVAIEAALVGVDLAKTIGFAALAVGMGAVAVRLAGAAADPQD